MESIKKGNNSKISLLTQQNNANWHCAVHLINKEIKYAHILKLLCANMWTDVCIHNIYIHMNLYKIKSLMNVIITK